jgi:hypothetical protein
MITIPRFQKLFLLGTFCALACASRLRAVDIIPNPESPGALGKSNAQFTAVWATNLNARTITATSISAQTNNVTGAILATNGGNYWPVIDSSANIRGLTFTNWNGAFSVDVFGNLTGNSFSGAIASGNITGLIPSTQVSGLYVYTNSQVVGFSAAGMESPFPIGAIHCAVTNAPLVITYQPYLGGGTVKPMTNDNMIRTNILAYVANGIIPNLKSNGLPVRVNLDVGSFIRDSDGFLYERTNVYPKGFTNLVDFLHTNGIQIGLMINMAGYQATNQPGYSSADGFWVLTNANYANQNVYVTYSAVAAVGRDAYWAQAAHTNWNPLMTPDFISNDIQKLYLWGVDTIEDNDTHCTIPEFLAIENTIAWNILYPNYSVFGRHVWNDPGSPWIPARTRPISFTAYENPNGGVPSVTMPDLYTAHNALQYDAPADSANYGSTSIQACREYRRYVNTYPNAEKVLRGHIIEADGSAASVNLMALCGWSPFFSGFNDSLANYSQWTNAGVCGIHNDPLQNFPYYVRDCGKNVGMIVAKPLYDGSVAVVLANESGSTATNLTVALKDLRIGTNYVCNFIDVRTGTVLGNGASFSTNLAANTSCLIRAMPLLSQLNTVNSPANGYYLRYTNGSFYYSP